MKDSDAINHLPPSSIPEFGSRLHGFRILGLAALCCSIGSMAQSVELFYLSLYLTDYLDWPMAAGGMWIGVVASGLTFAFLGGFLGDRTLKRKTWVGAGLAIQGIGLLLLETMYMPAVKAGLVLSAVGIILFQGNILVVVADFASFVGMKLEIAFVIIFCSIRIVDMFALPVSGLLWDRGLRYAPMALLVITMGLFWLLTTRHFPGKINANTSLINSRRWRIVTLLGLAFLATRAMNFVFPKAFSWTEEGGNSEAGISSLAKELSSAYLGAGIGCLVAVPLTILLAIHLLRRRGILRSGTGLLGLYFAAVGLALIFLGSGDGDSILRYRGSLAIAYFALSAAAAFIFVGLATLSCSIVSNRWRGTVTALLVGVPRSGNLMVSSWESWPLAPPLFAFGAAFILAGVIWHILVTRCFATRIIIQEGEQTGGQ